MRGRDMHLVAYRRTSAIGRKPPATRRELLPAYVH